VNAAMLLTLIKNKNRKSAHGPESLGQNGNGDARYDAGDQVDTVVVQDAQSAHVAHSLAGCLHNFTLLIDARELQQAAQNGVQQGAKKSA